MGNECCSTDKPQEYIPNYIKQKEVVMEHIETIPSEAEMIGDQSVGEAVRLPDLTYQTQQVFNVLGQFSYSYSTNQPIKHAFRFNKNGNIYEGQWLGKPQGKGRLHFPNGSVFEGSFKQGIAQGKGRFIYPNGSYYVGDIVDNNANGIGKYCSQPIIYEGQFHRNLFDGSGSETTQQGSQFTGIYKLGHKVRGTLVWDNNKYTGAFNIEGKFEDSKGKLTTKEGTYTGAFLDGEKHGQGVYLRNNGQRYVGNYSHGLKNGFGRLYNQKQQLIYEGSWKDDLPHGKGKAYIDGVAQKEVEWSNGVPQYLEQL